MCIYSGLTASNLTVKVEYDGNTLNIYKKETGFNGGYFTLSNTPTTIFLFTQEHHFSLTNNDLEERILRFKNSIIEWVEKLNISVVEPEITNKVFAFIHAINDKK